MHRAHSTPPSLLRQGTVGTALSAVVFFGVVLAAGAAFISVTVGDHDSEEPLAAASEPPSEPAAEEPVAAQSEEPAPEAAPSLEGIAWTTDARSTLQELSRTWSIPREVLATLNPDLPAQIEVGAEVLVYSNTLGPSFSVGPPNNGRLTRGVPLPEGRAWTLPEDRSRAFATAETIAAVTAALEAYGRRFPEAEPIQMGDLSAWRGGEIYGHQSHQSGRDVDIRLIHDSSGDGFDAERNWFLVKTLIDGGDVRAIFLNRREQTWLRAAADADVGAASAEQYFALIRHEKGHTIHIHVRFACPKQHKRCVAYSLPDTAEQDSKLERKLPRKLPRRPVVRPNRGTSKLPGRRRRGR